jgi:hypothetical protein
MAVTLEQITYLQEDRLLVDEVNRHIENLREQAEEFEVSMKMRKDELKDMTVAQARENGIIQPRP